MEHVVWPTALEAARRAAQLVSVVEFQSPEVDPADDSYYGRVLSAAWKRAASGALDLIVIEHDVIVTREIIEAFAACSRMHCAFTTWLGNCYDVSLGCVRYRWQLMRSDPALVTRARMIHDDGLGPDNWRRMDTRIARLVEPAHIHEPPAVHLHQYPTMPDD